VVAWGALLLAQGTALNATLLRPYSLVIGGVVVASAFMNGGCGECGRRCGYREAHQYFGELGQAP
jgi:hypothetical protein